VVGNFTAAAGNSTIVVDNFTTAEGNFAEGAGNSSATSLGNFNAEYKTPTY
jgi:hypothetical protein